MVLDGHDTLFFASELEVLNSLSAKHSVVEPGAPRVAGPPQGANCEGWKSSSHSPSKRETSSPTNPAQTHRKHTHLWFNLSFLVIENYSVLMTELCGFHWLQYWICQLSNLLNKMLNFKKKAWVLKAWNKLDTERVKNSLKVCVFVCLFVCLFVFYWWI
jgi:hypothetical protein